MTRKCSKLLGDMVLKRKDTVLLILSLKNHPELVGVDDLLSEDFF